MTLLVEFLTSATPAALEAICEGLTRQNVGQLERAAAAGIVLPRLYDTAVVYRRDPPGRELFRSLSRVYRPQPSWCGDAACPRCCAFGGVLCGPVIPWGDCDDLAGIVAAEHRHYRRRRSRVAVVPTRTAGLLHAIVEHDGGASTEDPTRIVRSLRP